MKMETKVDVHVVHPSVPPPSDNQGKPKYGPYGSWCTPEATPAHPSLTPKNSKVEPKSQNLDEIKYAEIREKFQLPQKVRLYPATPPHDEAIRKVSSDSIQSFKKPGSGESSVRFSSDIGHTPPQPESPQSPVPTSPVRENKYKGLFRSPLQCDFFMPIDPQGRGYISWLFLVTFCYAYNAWCIMLRASFPYQTVENTPIWMTLDYFCDLVYLLDVAVVKPRLMFLHEGFWVDDPEETKKHYMKKLQFKFDVISLLPLDILYVVFGPRRVILRAPRILKLQTFWEFHQAMDRVLASPYVVRIGKMLFYIFYLIHLNACAYYAMSDYIGLGSNGWVYDNQGNAYLRCFYFATKTATSIGKNPKPESMTEYLYMTAAWLMGVFVFALLIGQIRDIIATATRARTDYRKTVDGCTEYLRRLNTSKHLQRRVTSWFNYTWNQQRCFEEERILNSLPYNMKRDVALAVHMSILSKVQLFRDCSDSLLRDLVLQLRPVSFLPRDVVVRRGEVGHEMYIIKTGECCVMSHDEREVLATLKEGSVFGEISLLGIDGLRRRTATVVSRGYSNLFALSRSDLDAALKYHKEAAQVLRLRADQIIKENAARLAKERLVQQEGKKSANSQDDGLRNRKPSVGSNTDTRRRRSTSAHSRRKLSAVSENEEPKIRQSENRPSLASACSGVRTPIPTIVLSSE